MRILFCIKAMNNPGGGAERVLANVTSGLVDRGYEVAVLSFDSPGGQSFYPLHPKIVRIELGIGSTSAPSTVLSTLRRMVVLRKMVPAYAPDVVIGFMNSMFIPLGFALMGTSFPMIASEHIGWEHYRSRPLEALFLHLMPFMAERITCVSEQVLRSYPGSLQRKMVAIANPVVVHTGARADVLGSKKDRKVLLTVGRLEPQKDHATLIQAFSTIIDQVPDWTLRIVGEGVLRKPLELQVSALGIEGKVELVGATKDISREYMSAQLFVSSSRYESFGLTTAEALAYALPVVGFADCAGINQLIHPGQNGALADGSGDRVEALAEALKPVMVDDHRRTDLAQGNCVVPEEYKIAHVLDRWEKLLEMVKR